MLTFLKALLTVAVLWLISRSIDIESVIAHISYLSVETVVLAFALLLLQLLIASERLRVSMLMVSHRVTYRVAFCAAAEGNFFSHTFISVLGSDAARIWRCQRSGVPLIGATSGVLLDRLIGLTGNHVMTLVALPFLMPDVTDDWTRSGLWLLAVGFTVGLAVIYLLGEIRLPALIKVEGRWAVLHMIYEVSQVSRYATQNWPPALTVFVYSVVINTINVVIFYFLLRDLEASVGFIECLIVVPIIMQVSLLPISIGGWGVRESAAMIGLGHFGVASDVALAASVIFGLLLLVFSLGGGILWWLDRRPQSVAPKADG